MAHERKCIVCGAEYKYCSRCSQYNSEETWRYLYCSKNCRKIYKAFSSVKGGSMSKEEAKKEFKDSDLTNVENFNEEIKALISEVTKEPEPEKVEESPVTEELANLEVEVDEIASIPTPVKPHYYNKKKHKIVNDN